MDTSGRERMRGQFLGTLIFLMIQFLLGMAVNLSASFFAVAVVAYAVGLFVTGRPARA